MSVLIPLVHLIALPAVAQDGFDAHGFIEAPSDGDLLDPLTIWRAEPTKVGIFGISGLFEYAADPLVLETLDGEEIELLDQVAALNIAGQFGIIERVSFGFSAPWYFSAKAQTSYTDEPDNGLAFGDVRLSAPIAALYPEEGDAGFFLSVIPYADLPSGAQRRWVGNPGIAGGLLVAGRYGGDIWEVDANLGLNAAPKLEIANLQGGGKAIVALGGGVEATEWLGIRGELITRASFKKNDERGTETPSELTLSARGNYGSDQPWWTLGFAKGISQGAGAADFRAFFGVGYNFGKEPVRDLDGDGITDDVDACVEVPETVNAYKDEDGCPDQLATAVLTVVDKAGKPISGAAVMFGDKSYTSDPNGQVRVENLMPGTSPQLKVTAAKHLGQESAWALAEGNNDKSIALDPTGGKVKVTVKSDDGKVLDGKVIIKSNAGVKEPVQTGADGVEEIGLAPGAYEVVVTAEGYARNTAQVTVRSDETASVELVLKGTKIKVTAKEIQILQQVQFDTGKATIKPESFALLDEVAGVLIDNPQITKIEVQGHTDDVGAAATNEKLAQSRTESVVKYLTDKGVAASRLVPKGYGEAVPLVPNTNSANRAKNRRVQFVILEQNVGADGTTPVIPPVGAPRPTPSGGSNP